MVRVGLALGLAVGVFAGGCGSRALVVDAGTGAAGTTGTTVRTGTAGTAAPAGTTGTAGTVNAAGTTGRAGTHVGGSGGAAGTAGGSRFGEPACPPTIARSPLCGPSEPQFCYTRCGPERTGVKGQTCTVAGIYDEMPGCLFDPNADYACYGIPAAANAPCPAGVTPQAASSCDVPRCVLCNSLQGVIGGQYFDTSGAPKVGWCNCQLPNASGIRTWSCASDVNWPCPLGRGCDAPAGSGGTGGGTAGSTGADGGGSFGQPACASSVAKGAPCGPSDQQFCYKTCGPERTGVKTEVCTTAGTYAEMSGCSFDPSVDFSCYKLPTGANAQCPAGVTPQAASSCDVPHCVLCNSLQGVIGGQYSDATGSPKVGWCTCEAPNAAGVRSWSCASDTQWPCPIGRGC